MPGCAKFSLVTRACRAFLLLCVVVTISSCSRLAPYEPGADAGSYIVRTGDTLYSIAFRYGIDHRDLARWNGLADANLISVGQRLVLAPRGASGGGTATSASAPVRAVPATPSPASPRPQSAPVFQWPTQGRIAARFGTPGVLTTGIAISGRSGQDIVAAAPGRVVYAGGGLADYGLLIIVQHNDRWLTAYGLNRRLLVAQGDSVIQGQKMAEMGTAAGGEPRLYFEIRLDGNPRDPLGLLPASGG